MTFEKQETSITGENPALEQERVPKFTLETKQGVSLEKLGGATTYDSITLLSDGKVVDTSYWKTLSGSKLITEVLKFSGTIEQNPSIKAFTDGHLNADTATENGEMILGFQYLDMLRAVDDVVSAHQLTVDDIGKLLDYIYSGDKSKPFAGELTRTIFEAVLSAQRESLYQALTTRKRSLREASSAIDRLPYGGIFLLDGEPTARELSQSFTQTDDEAEKNLVIDSTGRIFLIRGINKNRGIITFRYFPDTVRDFHTHSIDCPFSTGDIDTYKLLGTSRGQYKITAESIDFFVGSPSGIFEFDGNLSQDVSDKRDIKTDSLTIPCSVVSEDTGESTKFLTYTNHELGEAGQYIQRLIKKGTSRLTITFDNGDTIRYASWKELESQGKLKQGIRQITLKNE